MEKIKDFFHDFSDVFFAIVVTSVMAVVLSLNLGSLFNTSSNTVLAYQPIEILENKDTNLILKDDTEQATPEDQVELEKEDSDTDTITTEQPEETPDKDNVDVKTIVIPNGTPGSGVAMILKENGLITDIQEFIQTAENLNLIIRLKSGSFEIPNNSTIEDMVKIIAGQKK